MTVDARRTYLYLRSRARVLLLILQVAMPNSLLSHNACTFLSFIKVRLAARGLESELMQHVSVVVAHPHGDGTVRRLAGGEAHQARASGRLEDGDGLPGGGESLHAAARELRHENGAVAADGDADGGVEEACGSAVGGGRGRGTRGAARGGGRGGTWRASAAANHAARLVGRKSGSALPAGGREREGAEAVRPVVRNDELRTAVCGGGQGGGGSGSRPLFPPSQS